MVPLVKRQEILGKKENTRPKSWNVKDNEKRCNIFCHFIWFGNITIRYSFNIWALDFWIEDCVRWTTPLASDFISHFHRFKNNNLMKKHWGWGPTSIFYFTLIPIVEEKPVENWIGYKHEHSRYLLCRKRHKFSSWFFKSTH